MKIILDDEFKNSLKQISKEYEFEFEEEVYDNLTKYKELLINWNEKINLTNITENYEVIVKHFIDCMHLLKYINEENRVIDVGTGAGFPGMVLAICNKNINITLLDALNKRLIFLEEVKNKLNLSNVNIIHARAEELAHDINYREKYDVVVSRAVASLNNLLEYTIGYLKVGRKALYMKGDNYNEEILSSKNALKVLSSNITNIYEYKLKIENEIFSRSIVEVKKGKNTLEKYPRNYGKMKKMPL